MSDSKDGAPETPQLKARKDKTCPFCGQSFTSSSLGRHLDLFIRAKNPKAPDGKHNVEEIRKMRETITRRNMKGVKRGAGEAGSSSGARRQSTAGASPTIEQEENDEEDDDSHTPSGPPSRALAAKTPEVRRVSRKVQKAGLEERQKAAVEAVTGKAAELALKELLKSVREAR